MISSQIVCNRCLFSNLIAVQVDLRAVERVPYPADAVMDIEKLCQLAHSGNCTAVVNALKMNEVFAVKSDQSGRTVLHWAASGGQLELVKLLIHEFHVDVDVTDEEIEVQDGLYVIWASPVIGSRVGWTPLIIATSAGHDAVVSYLLDVGANVNMTNSTGQCALHYAASKNRFKIAEMLLAKNANSNTTDQLGSTPLHRAASKGNSNLTKLLISFGADSNVRDSVGNTPLHLACEEDHDQDVRLLVAAGADATVMNKEDQTPFDIASGNVQNILRSLGAVERV